MRKIVKIIFPMVKRFIPVFVALTATLIAFLSCSPEQSGSGSIIPSNPQRTTNIDLEISESEAYENLLNFVAELGGIWEQCPNVYEIRQVDIVPGDFLIPFLDEYRIEIDGRLPENLLYIFNFNDGGFAVVSADRRLIENVFALASKGSLSANDLLYRRPLTIEGVTYNDYEELEPVIFDAVENGSFPYSAVELIMHSVATHFSFDYLNHYYYAEWETDSSTMQLLEQPLPKYCQWSPFNDSCPIRRNGDTTVAGCEPIALLMTLVYNSGNTFSFGAKSTGRDSLMNNYLIYHDAKVKSDLAYYSHLIGKKSWTKYGPESSTAFYRLQAVMAGVDEYHNVRINPFEESTVHNMITNNKPVILEGHGSGDHAFVVEGVMYDHRCLITWNDDNSYQTSNGMSRIRILCNFGWYDEKADGWYLKSVDSVIQTDSTIHYYGERLRMMTYDIE